MLVNYEILRSYNWSHDSATVRGSDTLNRNNKGDAELFVI